MIRVAYQEFELEPCPMRLRDGTWTLSVHIWRLDTEKAYSAANTFGTREEAIAGAIEFGRRIIDGAVPGIEPAGLP
ncbi:MAG: DUF6566 family protein [Gemmatimonadales bacterium]